MLRVLDEAARNPYLDVFRARAEVHARSLPEAERSALKVDPRLQRRVQRYGWDKAAGSYFTASRAS